MPKSPKTTRQSSHPDMPCYQPCPKCHAQAKRNSKSLGGASYYCSKCKEAFFVRHPRLRVRRQVA